jgi:hypothetical protein
MDRVQQSINLLINNCMDEYNNRIFVYDNCTGVIIQRLYDQRE